MPRNGSGSYTLPKPAFTPNTTISSADVNSDYADIAAALTGSIAADGQTPITGTLLFPSGSAAAPSHTFGSDHTTGMYFAATGQLGFSASGVSVIIMDSTKLGVGQDGSVLRYGNGAVIQPVGKVASYAGTTAPAGWLLIYGQAISRTSYPELFQVCSTTFGSGDGTTTFNLPDGRGRVDIGKDDMGGSAAGRITVGGSGISGITLGAAGGFETITLTTLQMPSHTHTASVNDPTHTHSTNAVQLFGGGGQGNANFTFSLATINAALTGISVTNSSAGSGGAHNNTQPGIVFNKIIFAGRP